MEKLMVVFAYLVKIRVPTDNASLIETSEFQTLWFILTKERK